MTLRSAADSRTRSAKSGMKSCSSPPQRVRIEKTQIEKSRRLESELKSQQILNQSLQRALSAPPPPDPPPPSSTHITE